MKNPDIGETVLLHLTQGEEIVDRPATVVNVYEVELVPATEDKPAKRGPACTLVGAIDRFRDAIVLPPESYCDGMNISVQNATEGTKPGQWSKLA